MEKEAQQVQRPSKQWLFDRRLQVFEAKSNLLKRKDQICLSQNCSPNQIFDLTSQRITRYSHIQQILKVLNSEIFEFRFGEDTPEKGSKGSKGEASKKKKENQKQTNKIKKFIELFNISESQEQQRWKKILRPKKVTNFLQKVYRLLFDIIQQNLELFEKGISQPDKNNIPKTSIDIAEHLKQGFVLFKDNKLGCQVKIWICILMIDIVRLIDSVKLALFPYNSEELKKLSLEEQQEKSQFEVYFLKVKTPESFGDNYRKFGNLSFDVFYRTLKLLTAQIQSKQPEYNLWVNIQGLKRSYITDSKGIFIKKSFQKPIQSTIVDEIRVYWIFYSNQYKNSRFSQNGTQNINLFAIFEDYEQVLTYLIGETVKNEQNVEDILCFFDLALGPWKELDRQSALRIFWDYFLKVIQKIKLPQKFSTQRFESLKQVCIAKRDYLWSDQKRSFQEQLFEFQENLCKQLMSQQEEWSLKRSYFETNKHKLEGILQKYKQKKINIQQYQVLAQSPNGFSIMASIKELSGKFNPQNMLKTQGLQKITFDHLMDYFQIQANQVEQIRHFLLLATSSQLEQCRKFYKSKREKFTTENGQISSAQSINKFGLANSIKFVTFQLITTIKRQIRQSQISQSSQNDFSQKQMQKTQEKLEKLVFKLLKLFEKKIGYRMQEQQVPPLFARGSSLQYHSNQFYIEPFMIERVEKLTQNTNYMDDQFTMKLIKNIFQIKIQVIQKKVQQLEKVEAPLKKEYSEIKTRVYQLAIKDNPSLKQQIKGLPEIEFQLIKKRFWPAWRKLTQIDYSTLKEIQNILQDIWGKDINILKIYVTLLIKYREMQQKNYDSVDFSESQLLDLVDSTLEVQQTQIKSKKELRQQLKRSVRMLSHFEEVKTLRNNQKLNQQKIKLIQQSKKYEKTKNEDLCFNKWFQGKVSAIQIIKNEVPINKKYTITPEPTQYDKILKRAQTLTKLHRNISLSKQKRNICLHVDQHEQEFQSYPKLVKYLLESYYQTIQFCQKKLNLELYPLVRSRHISIQPINQTHLSLRFNPYQGILLQILLGRDELKATNLYRYPQFPFAQLAEQLYNIFVTSKAKVYRLEDQTAEKYAFFNLIQQMKALSLEQEDGSLEATYKNILKCPYFWSTTEKFYELVQFKERYHNNLNIEESRRKQNQRTRAQISGAEYQNLMVYLTQKEKKDKHPLYRTLSSHNRTTQIYYSIEGLIQKQAFEEDIGNFREKNAQGELKPQNYKYHAYWWYKNKDQIKYLLQLVSERQKKKGSSKASVYEKTFKSFQNQIRNLRNLAVHHIYDSKKGRELTVEQKIKIFQQSFPKLFVFIYRWKPVIGKSYNLIQNQKIKLLCSLFPHKDNKEVIGKLQQISQLSEYNILNRKINSDMTLLHKMFNYDRTRVKSCYPCKLITMFMYKQDSFWAFLADAKFEKEKEEKTVFYNAFFWDHQQAGCNGMHFLERAFFNVSQRNQFTVEELTQIEQTKIMLKIQKQRLQRKIKRLENNQELEDEEQKSNHQYKENVEDRYGKLTANQKIKLHEQLALTDYVCKYFIFQLQMTFPYLFHDLRRYRHLWDSRARAYNS